MQSVHKHWKEVASACRGIVELLETGTVWDERTGGTPASYIDYPVHLSTGPTGTQQCRNGFAPTPAQI